MKVARDGDASGWVVFGPDEVIASCQGRAQPHHGLDEQDL